MTTPRVLFIDDTPSNLHIAEAYLEDLNCISHFAESGATGLQLSLQHSFDVIFLDLEMPGLNGMQTAKEIRAHCHTPIIAMTAHSKEDVAGQLNKKHFNGYIGKPFSEDELIQQIETHTSLTLTPNSKTSSTENTHKNSQYQDSQSQRESDQLLDLESVRQRLKNNESLIKRILESFAKNNTHTFNALCESLDKQDWVTAKRICHTLKGGGANIGAMALSAHSAILEKTCAARSMPEQKSLEKLNQLISSVIQACRNELNPSSTAKTKEALHASLEEDKIKKNLSSILVNLDQDIGLAQDQLDELCSLTPKNMEIAEMVSLLDQFDIARLSKTIEKYIGTDLK